MNSVNRFIIVAAAALLGGCAGQPRSTTAAATGGHESVALARSAVAQSPSAAHNDDDITRGYQHESVNGEDLYCQREALTGMRVMQKICMTKAQLQEAQQRSKTMVDGIERASSTNGKPMECRTMGSNAPC